MPLTFPAPAQIKNLQDPTDPQDAVTKAYADTLKVDPSKISNGTSNIAITTSGGNVTTSVGGIDSVFTVSQAGTNVKGSEAISGNLTVNGNTFIGMPGTSVYLGNVSNIKVYGGTTGQYLQLVSAATSTTVSVAVQAADTTISVAGTLNFPTSGYITIDSEVIAYTGTTSTTFTGCTRGSLNTTPASHGISTVVYNYSGGTIGFSSLSSNTIFNGTSNVTIPTTNGNVSTNVNGNTILIVTSTGANINGYANINSGTITSSNPVNVVQTWNNASATFTGILENITDTASSPTSKLIDLQVGGASKFNIDKNGNIVVGSGSGGTLSGLAGLGLGSMTVSGAVSGNANVSTVTGNLGYRAISSTYTDIVALASTTIANAAVHALDTPTLAASNTGVTFTNASTLYIANAPIAGTNATLTNRYALYIANGNSYFNNTIVSGTTTGTAPFVVNSTTKVANLYANASDFSNMTVATTGVYYPTFVGSSSAGLQQEYINSAFNVNATSGTFTANNVNVSNQLISTVITGTAPIVVNSTTKVANLYANVADYSNISVAATGTFYPTFVTSSSAGAQQEYVASGITLNAQTSNLAASILYASGQLQSGVITGTAPLQVTSTTRVANLNVSYSNVSDYSNVTTQTTGTFYPVFVNGSTSGNYTLSSNTGISFDAAAGQLSATKLNATDLTLSGNLLVNGTTTTINTSSIKVVDPLIELGGGLNGIPLTSNDGKDRGLLLHYGTSTGGPTSYRVLLNGTSTYITTPANANFALPGDFTIEAYVNPTNFATSSVLFSQGSSATASPFSIGIHTDGRPYVSFGIQYNATVTTYAESSTATFTAPTGTVFTSVLYGTFSPSTNATGTAPNYVISTNTPTSGTITTNTANTVAALNTAFIGKASGSIVVNTANLNNGVDPYAGTAKYLSIVLSYGLFSTTALTAGTWSHIAVTRIGSTVTIYVNGVAAGSTTYSTSIGSSAITTNTFGASYQSASVNTLYYNGSISNFRLIKGQGIFTGTFIPGYTNITTTGVGSAGSVVNTITGTVAVLTFQNATLIDNSTTPITLTASATAPTIDQSGFPLGGQQDAFIGYKTSTNEFIFANATSTTSEIVNVFGYGNVRANNFLSNSFVSSPGTLLTSSPAIQISQTWNNSSATFTGIYSSFTDTASSSTSKIIDFQVNGLSKFTVDKAGNLSIGGTFSTPTLATVITSSNQPYITNVGSLNQLTVSNATGIVNFVNTSQVSLGAVANLKITGGSAGQVLTTDGLGGLSFTSGTVSTFYVGTTAITTNRSSATQALTGISSIDGSAAKLTTPRLINGTPFDGSADITVPLSTTGNITSGNIATTFAANIGTTLTVNGMTTLQGVSEVLTSPTVGTYNLNTGTIFYHAAGAVTVNFTAAFTNVPAVGAGISRVVSATIVIAQGATAYIPSSITVNGAAATVKWFGGAVPAGTASAVDYFTYSIFVVSGAVQQVTGTYATYY